MLIALLLLLGTSFYAAPSAHAQTLTTLYNFCSQSNCTDGGSPQAGIVLASDGNLYGTTVCGGVGTSPTGGICTNGGGTVFKITPTGEITTLYSFCSVNTPVACADGTGPVGLVQGSDGNFYGTTACGGKGMNPGFTCVAGYGGGTVFKITPGGTLTTLYDFCSINTPITCADGFDPTAPLVQGSDGNFYGTTQKGGAIIYGDMGYDNAYGTVFKITPSGTFSKIYNFCSLAGCADGDDPVGGLVQGSDGNFYGTTKAGGPIIEGTVLQVTQGTVFKITPSGGFTTLYAFCSQSNCTDGQYPVANLIQGTNGNFYGTTSEGGADGWGEVYVITASGTLTVLASIPYPTAGQPEGPLFQDSQGNFFGTTLLGGDTAYGNLGTVFETTPSGQFNVIYKFCSQNTSCTDGAEPVSGLVQDSHGNFYGTTSGGGANYISDAPGYSGGATSNTGTVFKLAPLATLSSNNLTFPSQAYNTSSAAQSVTFSNPYFGDITVSNVSISGGNAGDFSETNTCAATLTSGTGCQISVIFTPQGAGTRTASLVITNNPGGGTATTQTVTLSGTGTVSGPALTLSSANLNFNSQLNGSTSAAQSVTLSNSGNAALSISSISIAGADANDFSQTNTCGSGVAAGANCKITVMFVPTAAGSLTAIISFADNAPGSPQTVSLSGTSEDFSVTPASGAATSATVAPGQTATYNLSMTAAGGLTGAVSLACTGAPSGATCTVSPSSVNLSGSSSASATVSLATTASSQTSRSFRWWSPMAPTGPTLIVLLELFCLLGVVSVLTTKRVPRVRNAALALALASLMFTPACGGGGGSSSSGSAAASNSGTPAGTFNLTVTATLTSGTTTVQHTITLSLTVS